MSQMKKSIPDVTETCRIDSWMNAAQIWHWESFRPSLPYVSFKNFIQPDADAWRSYIAFNTAIENAQLTQSFCPTLCMCRDHVIHSFLPASHHVHIISSLPCWYIISLSSFAKDIFCKRNSPFHPPTHSLGHLLLISPLRLVMLHLEGMLFITGTKHSKSRYSD